MLASPQSAEPVGKPRQTAGEFFRQWLGHAKGRVRPTTYEGYETLIRVHAIPAIGEIPLEDLAPLDLQGLYSSMLSERGLSGGTVRNTHLVLTQALGQAVRWGLATDPLGSVMKLSYDSHGDPTSVTDPGTSNGTSTTTYKYDSNGNVVEEDDPAPLNYVKNWKFNSFNEPTSYTDGRTPRRTTRYEYDSNGNPTCTLLANVPAGITTCSQADPEYKITYGYFSSGAWAGSGLVQTRTEPYDHADAAADHTWTYDYDSLGNLNSIVGPPTQDFPNGSKTTMHWNDMGQMDSRVDPRGYVAGNQPDAFTWIYGHNNAGQLTSVLDPIGDPTSYEYDPAGLRTKVTDANQYATRYEYDANGDLTCVLAPTADPSDTCATAPASDKTTYTYDESNNLFSKTDANQHTWSYRYDDANRLHTTTSPMGSVWTNEYYADGALQKRTLPSYDTVTYSYDQLNRLTVIAYSDGSTPNVTYGYDANGNRTSMADGSGTVTYSYDSLNHLAAYFRGSDLFSYQYSPAGQVKQVTYPDNTQVDYAYNHDDTLASVTQGGAETDFSYYANGELKQKVLPASNGYATSITYDPAGRLASLSNDKGGSTLSSYTYWRDAVGNPQQIQAGSSDPQTYQYDQMNRIKLSCAGSCSDPSTLKDAYTYDPVGNVQEIDQTGGSVTSYAYNADDEACWANADFYNGSACGSPPSGATSFSYDANGNQTSNGQWNFTWDEENRLSTAENQNTLDYYGYTYDGDGNRLTRTQEQQGSSTTYLWDTNAPVAQLAMERSGSGDLIRRDVYAGGPVSMREGGQDYYYLDDGQGNIGDVTSSGGDNLRHYAYSPFGKVDQANDSGPANPMQYQGQYLDVTDLYNLRARMYDPASAQFLERDPMAANPTMSSYAYANDAPMTMSDPSGMFPWSGLLQAAVLLETTFVTVATDGLAAPLLEAEVGGLVGGEAAAEAESATPLTDLADEVRTSGLHPAAVNQRTIAVGADTEGNLFAGSSNGFDAGQRAALERLGIERVPGSATLHAEEELLRGVPDLERIGTSVRAPCGTLEHNCLLQLIDRGVEIES